MERQQLGKVTSKKLCQNEAYMPNNTNTWNNILEQTLLASITICLQMTYITSHQQQQSTLLWGSLYDATTFMLLYATASFL